MPLTSRAPRRSGSRAQLRVEQLEAREVPYAVSGGAWIHPELITISFVPDGTVLGYNSQGQAITSTLFSDFGSRWSTGTWQTAILKGAQVWARQTNINFAIVADDGSEVGLTGQYQQGAPNYGDIRIGGANYTAQGASFLAQAWMPPQINNWAIAGDIQFNTAAGFNVGSTFDLFTVAAHEVGHALGLDHSGDPNAVMYSAYPGLKTDLIADDVNGIRNIYSNNQARAKDAYEGILGNNGFTTSTLVGLNATTKTALVTDLDITTTTDADFFKFVVPAGSSSTVRINVQSAGLSLLAPKVYLYNSFFQLKGFANGTGLYGTTQTITFTGIAPLQIYYVKVTGADLTAFGTGKYALTINTGTGADPVVPLPNTQTANGTPLVTGGGQNMIPDQFFAHGHDHDGHGDHRIGFDAATVASGVVVGSVAGITLETGAVDTVSRKEERHERRGPKLTPAQRRLWERIGSEASAGEVAEETSDDDLDPLAWLSAEATPPE
jgi:predicted Zn-dependent protease